MANQPQISAANRKYVSPSFTGLSDPFYSTIQAAINSITDASPTNTYGIYVYPGNYNESITLTSYISILGSGIQSTIIKGNGTNPAITGPASDSGAGQCYIVGLTIDGNGQGAFVLPDNSQTNYKNSFFFDIYIVTSVSASTAITVENNQSLIIFNTHIINQSVKYNEGILTTGNAQVRIHNSEIAFVSSYCIDHQSTAYTEAYNSFIVGGAACNCTAGIINLYVCQIVGRIDAYNSSKVKHVDSFHAGSINSYDSSTIWVSGLGWAEESQSVVTFFLSGSGSKIIVTNSRANVSSNSTYVVYVNSTSAIFKAFNSQFNNPGSGATITGVSGATVYLYYCVMNKDISTVSKSSDSVYIVSANSE